MEKIKTLIGIVPICLSCKKIRDDKGYWNRLETFISAHTNADFTFVQCGDCGKSLSHTRGAASVRTQ